MTRKDEDWKYSPWMTIHNLVGHPVSEVVWLAGIATRQQWISDISVAIHDYTLPAGAKAATELLNDADATIAIFARNEERIANMLGKIIQLELFGDRALSVQQRVEIVCTVVDECVKRLDTILEESGLILDKPFSAAYGDRRVSALEGCSTRLRQRVQHLVQQIAMLEKERTRIDAKLTRVRVAIDRTGEPDVEPYPEEPGIDSHEKALRSAGRVIPDERRVTALGEAVQEAVAMVDQALRAVNAPTQTAPFSAQFNGSHSLALVEGLRKLLVELNLRLATNKASLAEADSRMARVYDALDKAGEPSIVSAERRIASLASSRDIFKFNCNAIQKLFEEQQLEIEGGLVDAVKELLEQSFVGKPYSVWGEDDGVVLWWKLPIVEPPYVGTPLDDDWPFEAEVAGERVSGEKLVWTKLLEPKVKP